jgi:hypothetical protein
MLYEMLTGQVPYDAETPMAVVLKHITAPLPLPREVNPVIPETVERVVLKALAKAPADRYQSAGELAGALKKTVVEVEESPVALPEVRKARARLTAVPFWRRVPLWAWGAIVSVVLLIWVGGAFLLGRGAKPGPTPLVIIMAGRRTARASSIPTATATAKST